MGEGVEGAWLNGVTVDLVNLLYGLRWDIETGGCSCGLKGL